jgi:hypothetical protein
MSARCNDCTFCNEDISILQGLLLDARSRGNFRLANGLEKALRSCSTLQTKLKPADRAFLENIARIAKSDAWSIDDQTDLLMNAQETIKIVKQISEPHQEPRPQESGFRGQVNAAFHVQPTETDEPESTQPTSVFCSMLQAASGKGEQSHTVIERVIQTNHEDIIPRNGVMTQFERVCSSRTTEALQPEPQISFGFLRQLDSNYQAHVADRSEEPHGRIPCGFSEMMEAAFPNGENRNLATEHEKPHVRGMGFAAMLDGARRGTE